MHTPKRLAGTCAQALGLIPVLAALFLPFAGRASDAVPSGYAPLVRQAAPSVVTVIVEEQRIGAAEHAAARATAESGEDAVGTIIRRLVSGATGTPGDDDRAARALGSGFVIRADGLIVTNRHVIAGARTVRVRLSDARELPAKIVGADALPHQLPLRSPSAGSPCLYRYAGPAHGCRVRGRPPAAG